MKKLFVVTIVIFSFTSIFAQSADEAAIRKVLNAQETAWNSGNIENFMKGYWVSDSLIFVGKSVTYGWQKTLDRYKKGYPDTAAMGKLSYDLLEFKPLSPEYYFVVGKWHLQRSIGDIGGYFTLLFKKIQGQWFIIADHSS
jgi:ketosteroid isomerase-like protein